MYVSVKENVSKVSHQNENIEEHGVRPRAREVAKMALTAAVVSMYIRRYGQGNLRVC